MFFFLPDENSCTSGFNSTNSKMADFLKWIIAHTFVFILVFNIYQIKVNLDTCMHDIIHVSLTIGLHVLDAWMYFAE